MANSNILSKHTDNIVIQRIVNGDGGAMRISTVDPRAKRATTTLVIFLNSISGSSYPEFQAQDKLLSSHGGALISFPNSPSSN
jgi:hypothetical protein